MELMEEGSRERLLTVPKFIEPSVTGCVRHCQVFVLPDVGQVAAWELPFLG